jgi:hypothetical protein
MQTRENLRYVSQGYLHGTFPSGVKTTVCHLNKGRTGYCVYWGGVWRNSFGQRALERTFGVASRPKKSGAQEGYPAEPTIRALWRNLVDSYNAGDMTVTYSSYDPN